MGDVMRWGGSGRTSAELDGPGRLQLTDHQGRDHEDEETDEKGADVYQWNMPPFEFYHGFGDKIGVFREGDKAIAVLQPADEQAKNVAEEKAKQRDISALVKKNALDGQVG